ncbi:hypothetical protein ABPG73_005803 [Tetrahymena malaccensis]
MGNTQSYLQSLLLFALTSSNHLIPVSIDIKVNLLEAEKEFGITAFISKYKTQTQYILFDSSSSKLISMTPEINQFVFSTIHNFNKVALASFFPFIQHFKTTVGSSLFSKTSQMTLNSIRTKQLFSNQSIRSLNSDENRTNKKKEYKKPKSLKDQYIIQKQITEAKDGTKKQQEDQYQREQNKKQRIINSLRDKDIEESFSEDDDRKYRNIQFLLVVNSQDNLFMQLKSRRVQSLSDFKFYLMNLNLYTCPSPGLEQIKYLELTQIKSINPLHNSKFILQIYNDDLDGYMTNLHTFRNSDIQCILTELETKGIKESNRNSNNQDKAFYSEDEEDENDYDLINSRRGGGYREVQLNNFDGYQKNNDNSELIHQLAGTKAISHDDLDKSLKSTNFGRGESLFTQKRENGGIQVQINTTKNINEEQAKDQNQEISIHHINTKQEKLQKNIEQSSLQAFKHNQLEISSSFQFAGVKQQNYNHDIYDYSYYPQQKFNELDNNNQIIDQTELKDQNLALQNQNQIDLTSAKNSNYDHQKPLTSKKLQNNEFINVNLSQNKLELLSPNENNSSQKIYQFKSTGLLSQAGRGGESQQNLSSTNKVNELFQQQSTNSQLMNDVLHNTRKNLQPKRQVSLSVHSLSKKRKQIIASHKNQIRYLKDALDQSSNHSRQSTASSTKKATKRIILERNTIGVMKAVNLIGIFSFLIIIAVIVEQYISMHIQFNQFADDLNYVNWSTQYEISLYLIMKNYNLNTLLSSEVVNVPSNISTQMQDTATQEMYQSVSDINSLIKNLSRASSDLQILKGMLQTQYFFKLGTFLDHSIPIQGQSSTQMFLTTEHQVSLYEGSIFLVSYLFRYSRGLGTGVSQYTAVTNQEAIVKALKEVSIECQNFSISQLSGIEVDVNNVLIIIIIVTAFCIFIIIPLYSFIQSKREQIIQLFGTFNSSFIDESIYQIQKIYSKNNNIKQVITKNQSKENQKKQNLSSTSKLNKLSRGVLIMALMIFLLTLPYPILNKALSTSYINQNKDSLPLLEKLYSIQAFILDYTSLSFFTLVLKAQASSIQFSYQDYESKLASYVQQSQDQQTSLQQILQQSRNSEMFDLNTFNNYFMATFENDSCGNIFKYPQYLPQNYTITQSSCKSTLQGIMNKGLSISINNFFQILQNLQQIIQVPDMNMFQAKLDLFSKENNLQEFVTFQVYLVEILEALSIYLKSESNEHKSQLENILLEQTSSNKHLRQMFINKLQQKYQNYDKGDQKSLLGILRTDQQLILGKEYVFKEIAYGENEQLKQEINQFFLQVFQTERNEKKFGMIDIYYLVFITEVLQNFTKFEMILIQYQKNIDLKFQQIVSYIKNYMKQQKDNLRLERDDQQIFSQTYYQALLFDELINQAQQNLQVAVNKKIQLLLYMKNKLIDLEQIQVKLEELLNLRNILVESISLLIKINQQNHQLYEIYVNYHETISFSDQDIHLQRYNKFQKQYEKELIKINSSHSCVLFASLKTDKQTTKINNVSNNFHHFFGFNHQIIMNKPVEVIIPGPIANIHQQFIAKLFDSGRTNTKINEKILFALTQSNHIIPINIDLKVNTISVDNEFGIVSLFHKIQNESQYILFDSSNSRLISMTYEISQFIFSSLSSFNKVNLTQFFPFISKFRQKNQEILSTYYQNTKLLSLKSNKSQEIKNNQASMGFSKLFAKAICQNNQDSQNLKEFINKSEQQKEKVKNCRQQEKKIENQPQNKNELKSFQELGHNNQNQIDKIQFLLILNQTSQLKQELQNKSQNEFLSLYQFFTMSISVNSLQVENLDQLKYIEVTQMKQINPYDNSRFIQSVYNDCAEGFQTNFHHLNTSDIECILFELEQNILSEEIPQNFQIDYSNQQLDQANIMKNYQFQHPYGNEESLILNRLQASHPNQQQFKLNKEEFNIFQKEQNESFDQNQKLKQKNQKQLQPTNLDDKIFNFNQNFLLTEQNQQSFYQNIKQNQNSDQIIQDNLNQHDLEKCNAAEQDNQRFQDFMNSNFQDIPSNDFIKRKNNEQKVQNLSQNEDEIQQQALEKNHIQQQQQYQFNEQLLSNQEINSFPFISTDRQQQNQNKIEHFQSFQVNSPTELIQSLINPNLSPILNKHAIFSNQSPNNQSIMNLNSNNQNCFVKDMQVSLLSDDNQLSKDQSPKVEQQSKIYQLQNSNHKLINYSSQVKMVTVAQDQGLQNKFASQFSNIQETRDSKLNFDAKKNETIAQVSQDIRFKQSTKHSYHSQLKTRKLKKNSNQNQKKNFNELQESSTNSRNTSYGSLIKTTKQIILQKKTLETMKLARIIGLLSLSVMIFIIIQQFLSIKYTINQYQNELDYIDWATQYKIGLSSVMKQFNYARLLDGNYLLVAQNKTFKLSETTLSNKKCIDSVNDVGNLLIQAFEQGNQRQIFDNMINQQYKFDQGSQVNRSQPLQGQTYNIFNLVEQEVTLFSGVVMIFGYLYRYSRNVGFGTPQWIVVNNSEQITNTLIQLSSDIQQQSFEQLQQIDQQILNELFVIVGLSALCIFLTIPVYFFIQKQRESIISLFGTFSTHFIDSCIQDIKNAFIICDDQSTFKDIAQENIKRQLLSQTSTIRKTNFSLIFGLIFIFIMTLVYPLLNKIFASQYIQQSKSKSTSFDFHRYIPKLEKLINEQSDVYVQFQQRIEDLMKYPMSDQNNFDQIYSQAYQNDICQLYNQYPSYFNAANSTFNLETCNQVYQNSMQKGLTISIKLYFGIMEQLYQVFTYYNNTALFNQAFINFQNQYNIPEKLMQEQNQKWYDMVFTFLFSIYIHVILIPSIIFSGILVGNYISSINISLTLIIGLLISNNDYDFLVTSKDALRQRYSGFQTIFQLLEMICYIISIVINTSSSLLILILIFVSEMLRLIILKPYFANRIQILNLSINNYLLKFVITLTIIIRIQQSEIHCFSFLVVIYLPISYKISEMIQSYLTKGHFQNFENYIFHQEEIQPSSLNYVARNFFARKDNFEHAEIKAISYLIQYKQITENLSGEENIPIKSQRQQFLKKIQKTYLSEHKNSKVSLLGHYKADHKFIEGKEYVFKEQAYGENEQLKQEINQFFLDIFEAQRKNKDFGIIDIYYLVFIIEILQNFTKFEMVLTQSQKYIDLKYSQILSSIKQSVQKHKDNLKLIRDEKLIFSPTYYQALLFDELINQTFQNLEQAIQKKIQLLYFMKSRYIDLEQIQSKLEDLLNLRKALIEQISLLIRVNEYNTQLYDIYLNYLETISFSDQDIHLMKYNKFQKQQEQKLFKINSSLTCILFASLKSDKQATKINKVSNNFQQFFGFKPQLIISKPIEVLMPTPIANIHSQFLIKFFDSGRNKTNLNNNILFALTQSNHIIPVNIDFKVNIVSIDNEFGITSLLHKVINQCQYILFDANNSRLISMTYEISQFIFSSLKSFERVNLTQFFPIIQQFRQNQYDQLSSHYSKTSQLTQKTNKSQKMFNNAISIKYLNIFAKSNLKTQKDGQGHSLQRKENVNQLHIIQERKQDHKNEFEQLKQLDQNEQNQVENICFLLIINQNQSQKSQSKNKSQRGLNSYSFFTMNISVKSLQVQSLEHIKYIEITQIKQINPFTNSKLIRSIYNSCIEGYETNFHYLNYSDVECILSELDQSSLNDETLIQNGQFESEFGQLNQTNNKKNSIIQQSDEDNSLVLFNRYASNTFNRQSKQMIEESSISQKREKDTNDFKAHYQHLKQKLINSQKSQQLGIFQEQKTNQLNNKPPPGNYIIEQQNISQAISNNADQSQQQFLKFNETSNQKCIDNFQEICQTNIQTQQGETFMQRSNNQYQEFNYINSQIEIPQQPLGNYQIKQQISNVDINQQNQGDDQNLNNSVQNQNDVQLFQQLHINSPFELIQSPVHQTLSPINNQHAIFPILSPNIQSPLNSYNNNQNSYAKGYLLSQMSNNHPSRADQSTQIKSSIPQNNNHNSNYQLLNNNTSLILSPAKSQKQILQNQFAHQFSNFQELRGSKINNEILLNDILARDSINIMQKQNTQQSCRSLSKKRKIMRIQHKNEIKNIKDALDSSSNHSRETSSSNQTKTTKSIILQKHTLGIMKFVKIIGLLSFFILLVVVVQQFFSIQGTLSSFQNELNYIDWATQYKIGLSLVMKYNNYGRLIDGSYLVVSQNKTFKSTQVAISNQQCIDSVNIVGNLLKTAFEQGSQRKIFNNIISQQYIFQQGSQVDRTQPLTSKTAYNIFSLVPQQMILFQAVIILFSYTYRYSRNVGAGTSQWIVVNNSEKITDTLIQLSSDVQQFSLDELVSINQQLLNELFVIIILSGACIFIIIPVYSFIQSKREQIISLFGTFSSSYIDSCIQDMKKFYQTNNNYKELAINDNSENIKRQVLSQTSKLNRTHMGIITASVLVFVLTLPYPILNKILAQEYIEQCKKTLPMINSLLNMESFIIDETSYHLFTLLIKQSKSTSFDFKNYVPILNTKIQQQSSIYVQFQQSIQDLINVPVSDQNNFDNIYNQIYQNDICQIFIQNPSYFNSVNSTFTPQACNQIYQNTMSKGLTISIKIYFDFLEQFYQVFTTYNNTQLFNQTFLNFQNQYNIPQVLEFQDFIVYIIQVQRVFLTNMNSNYNQSLQTILFGLLFYQILIMVLILYFGWIAFYIKMDEYLHQTKIYLAVLNIRYLIQNPYVQNYLHKNLQ